MQIRDATVLGFLARSYTLEQIARELKINSSIVGKIVRRLEKRGFIQVQRKTRPLGIRILVPSIEIIQATEKQKQLQTLSLKERALSKVGLRCVNCGIQDIRVLCINHKNHDGKYERKRFGSHIYDAIVNHERITSDLDIRCFNCNFLYEQEHKKGGLQEGVTYAAP